MLKKYKINMLVGLLIIIGIIMLIMLNIYGERSMGQVIGNNLSKVTKLEFDVDDGNRTIVVTDKKAIALFVKKLNGMRVKKCYTQPSLIVFLRPVKLYIGNQIYRQLDLGNATDFIDVSCTRYEIVKGSISAFDIKALETTFGYGI